MDEYNILRSYVKQLKRLDINKDKRRELISNASSQSSLEAKISNLQFKEAGFDISLAFVSCLYTSLGINIANNLSNDFIKNPFCAIVAISAVAPLTFTVSALDNIVGGIKNAYKSVINRPYLIKQNNLF